MSASSLPFLCFRVPGYLPALPLRSNTTPPRCFVYEYLAPEVVPWRWHFSDRVDHTPCLFLLVFLAGLFPRFCNKVCHDCSVHPSVTRLGQVGHGSSTDSILRCFSCQSAKDLLFLSSPAEPSKPEHHRLLLLCPPNRRWPRSWAFSSTVCASGHWPFDVARRVRAAAADRIDSASVSFGGRPFGQRRHGAESVGHPVVCLGALSRHSRPNCFSHRSFRCRIERHLSEQNWKRSLMDRDTDCGAFSDIIPSCT